MPTLVKREAFVTHYAVEFKAKGKTYRTLWTKWKGEAEAWLHAVEVTGWSVSGRPLPC